MDFGGRIRSRLRSFLFWYSQSSNQATIKLANDRISEAVATANDWIAGNSKLNGEAIQQQLVSVLQNEDATMKSEGEAVLALVRTKLAQRKATSIFENAKLRLEENKVSQAIELHKKDVNDPHAIANHQEERFQTAAELAEALALWMNRPDWS